MNKKLADTNYAFEVDLEKMEGKYLFDTGKTLQSEAEKLLLEKCNYTHVVKAEGYPEGERVIYNEDKIWGLSLNSYGMPAGDSITTQLATEKGFICQVWANFWEDKRHSGDTIYILSDGGHTYPITITNTPEDVLGN